MEQLRNTMRTSFRLWSWCYWMSILESKIMILTI